MKDPCRAAVLEAVKKNGRLLEFAGVHRQDRDVCLAAIAVDPLASEHCAPSLLADRSFARAVLAAGGHLYFFTEEIKDDRELALFGLGLPSARKTWSHFLTGALRADREVALAALAVDAGAYTSLSNDLKGSIEIGAAMLSSAKAGRNYLGGSLPSLSTELLANKAFVNLAAQLDPMVLFWAPSVVTSDPAVVFDAVVAHPQAFGYLDDALRNDLAFVERCLDVGGGFFQFLEESHRADRALLMKALRDCPTAFESASEALRSDRDIARLAVAAHPLNLQFVAYDWTNDLGLLELFLKQGGWVYQNELLYKEGRSERLSPAAWELIATYDARGIERLPTDLCRNVSFLKRVAARQPLLLDRVDDATRAALLTDPALARGYKELKASLVELSIDHPERFPPQRLMEVIANRRGARRQGDARPLAVVIAAKTDEIGALCLNNYDDIMKSHRLLYAEAGSVSALREALDAMTSKEGPASLFVLTGHGTKDHIALGAPDPVSHDVVDHGGTCLDLHNVATISGVIGRAVRAGGHLVLMSCSTGEGRDFEQNMAAVVHDAAPHAHVHAPTCRTSGAVRLDDGAFASAGFRDGALTTYTIAARDAGTV